MPASQPARGWVLALGVRWLETANGSPAWCAFVTSVFRLVVRGHLTIVAIPFGTAAVWASIASRWRLFKRGADAVEMPVPPASITDHQVITLVTEAKA